MTDGESTLSAVSRRESTARTGREPTGRSRTYELPHDLLVMAAKRLRIVSLVFAVTFFLANFLPFFVSLLSGRDLFARQPNWWVPGTVSIGISLAVFALSCGSRVHPRRLMDIGLLFGVVGSFGIGMAENWGNFQYVERAAREIVEQLGRPLAVERITALVQAFSGLSWTAIWMVFFAILIPNRPKKTLVALLASATAVPITYALSQPPDSLIAHSATAFFFGLVFPYLLCACMGYFGARILYRLGTDVSRARELGSYQLVEKLGQGGMGEVWRAKHRMLARPAAIKLVRKSALGAHDSEGYDVTMKRFEREAQATALMHSPHTIALYDFGRSDDGAFYYVMELLDGFDTETLVKRFGPVPPERAVHLLRQICHSLAEAHGAGLIHRDIKPANVFACRYGREVDFVKVLDFGLVKSESPATETNVLLTRQNVARGTPAFMAPEQILGDRPVDGRTDLYAVGCLAYWLLTGELVFAGDTPMKVMMQHAQATPVPPAARAEIEIPPALESIVMRCLEKDPQRRYPSADGLCEALCACSVRPEWSQERARRWWDTHKPRSAR